MPVVIERVPMSGSRYEDPVAMVTGAAPGINRPRSYQPMGRWICLAALAEAFLRARSHQASGVARLNLPVDGGYPPP